MNASRAALRVVLVAWVLPWILAGCADANLHADSIAATAHLQRDQIDTGRFVLTSFYRISRPDLPLTIYIEGDGLAWRSRTQPSFNPTPQQATGLALAAADPAPNVLYLARPCQFTPMALNPGCDVADWTGKRFSEEVVVAMNQAVTRYAMRVPGQPVNLVGYSGGGALAVLIAARRHDVASLRTVAGNLDQAEVNRLHRVSAMPESLNAIDVALQVAAIAQVHFSGMDDTVVPAVIAQRFISAVGGHCTQLYQVTGMRHAGDWASQWQTLLKVQTVCAKGER